MRATVSCILGVTLALTGCGEDEVEAAEIEVAADGVEVEAEAPIVTADPVHGGTVIAAGPHPVEVVAHESGQVYAYVHGDDPPRDVEMTVHVPVEQRQSGRPVRMVWNPRESRYEGRVRRLAIVPGPLDVDLVVAGHEYHGHVAVIVVAPAIVVEVVEPSVEVVHIRRGKHKHKHKHRGRGHGRGVEVIHIH